MHGDADNTVPEWMGQRVFDAALGPKRYVVFPGAGHSEISNEFVVPAVSQFIDDVLRTPGESDQLATAAGA
jgi:fermentation-respiration switch protein FrsA (DUF1100 family)